MTIKRFPPRSRLARPRLQPRPYSTWTCHVCGDVRPDARISVRSQAVAFRGIEIKENVRYCNDRPECVEGSKTVTFLGGA